jgi:hypothetical protein
MRFNHRWNNCLCINISSKNIAVQFRESKEWENSRYHLYVENQLLINWISVVYILECLFSFTIENSKKNKFHVLYLRSVPRPTVTDSVYGRKRSYTAAYTTVFGRNTCDRITIVCDRDRIRRDTAKYGDRIGAFSIVNGRILFCIRS